MHVHHVRRRSINPSQQNSVHNTVQDNVKKGQPKEPHGKNSAQFTDNKTLLRLHAFGKPLNLNLVRTEGLFNNGGLKIWTVEPNATSQHGLEYVEIPQVSLLMLCSKREPVAVDYLLSPEHLLWCIKCCLKTVIDKGIMLQ